MDTMYIKWEDNSPLELLNDNMNEVAERYDCTWDAEKGLLIGDNAFFPAIELSEYDWFTEHARVWFLFKHIPDSPEVEALDLFDLYCVGKDNPPYAVMYLEFSRTRREHFFSKGSESMTPYDFCRAHDILHDGDGLFLGSSEDVFELMEALAGLIAEDKVFLSTVSEWQVLTGEGRLNMLRKILEKEDLEPYEAIRSIWNAKDAEEKQHYADIANRILQERQKEAIEKKIF